MNIKYFLQRMVAPAMSLAAIGLLSSMGSSWGASISFVPTGSPLDGDPILDIETETGEMITFEVFLDTKGLGSTGSLDISYDFTWDSRRFLSNPGELGEEKIIDEVDFGEADEIACVDSFAICSVFYSGLPLNLEGTLTTIAFNVLPELINDGSSDFDITLSSATVDGVDATDQFTQTFQEVEVQPAPEPTSTLSFLALGTLGAASTKGRKLKPSKSLRKRDDQ